MKNLKILNTIAIGLPAIIALLAVTNEEILLAALAATIITGILQLIAGSIFWLKQPTNIHIKIYFAGVALFFISWYLTSNSFVYIYALPVILSLYLSFILYSTPNEIK